MRVLFEISLNVTIRGDAIRITVSDGVCSARIPPMDGKVGGGGFKVSLYIQCLWL